MSESESLIDEATEIVEVAVDKCLEKGITDWGKLKGSIRDDLSDFIWERTNRKPMILPIIMEV